MTPRHVLAVSGAAGTGKTTLATAWAEEIGAAVVDLDEVAADVVAEGLRVAPGRREVDLNSELRSERYGALYAEVAHLRQRSAVVAVAPFTWEIGSREAWADFVSAIGGEPVTLVWMHVDTQIRRERIERRGASRDHGRTESLQTATPPAVPAVHVDAGSPITGLLDELRSRLGNEASEH